MHRESLAEPGELRAETETYLGRVRELAPCIGWDSMWDGAGPRTPWAHFETMWPTP